MANNTDQTQPNFNILLSYYNQSQDPKIVLRAQVVMLHLKGKCTREICEVTFKQERQIYRWIKSYTDNGIGSIFPGYYQNQNASKLTQKQKEQVKQLLKENPPSDKFWTIEDLKQYISTRFDIEYKSDQSYYGILQFCNYSYKLPALFNIKRNDELVIQRIEQIKQEIKLYLDNPNYLIFASDESRIEWKTLKRRAWFRKGKQTVIKEIRNKEYQNFIGFLNIKTGEDLLYRLDWQDQEHLIPVLLNLVKKYPDKKIIIIWDNAKFHRGKLLRQHLGEGNMLENIHLIWLPPYAPDHNPQEKVWKFGKDEIGNLVFNRFDELVNYFESSITGRLFGYGF